MCLAIYKPADTRPDWTAYKSGHAANDDSWGFAAVVDGALVVRCGIGNFEEFREAFEPYFDRQAIIHFRYATHGKTNVDNCHPFMVAEDLAVIHNGIIGIKCEVNADMSDTWHFNELVLKPMHSRDPDFYRRPEVVYSQEMAHSGSKFIFLRADGDSNIWNAEAGDWASDGHWYSNDSHCGYYSRYTGAQSSSTVERRWVEVGEGRYRYEEDSDGGLASATIQPSHAYSEYEEEREEAFYSDLRQQDLIQYGFSRECLREVFELLGHYGIEQLHDAM